jgi:hypothetical protein
MPDLSKGLASITLDPSPNLRRLRHRIEQENLVAGAWNDTAQALLRAVRNVRHFPTSK